jgi:adenine/guanine phosphoribosyltransferase-like PRPP-binding protein
MKVKTAIALGALAAASAYAALRILRRRAVVKGECKDDVGHLKIDEIVGEHKTKGYIHLPARCVRNLTLDDNNPYRFLKRLEACGDVVDGSRSCSVPLSWLLPLDETDMRRTMPYVDTVALCRLPFIRGAVIEQLSQLISPDVTCIVSFDTRAIIFGVLVAQNLKLKFVPSRPVIHSHGMHVCTRTVEDSNSTRSGAGVAIDMDAFSEKDKVALVDDVVSSGATLTALKSLLEQHAVAVVQCVCLVSRDGGQFPHIVTLTPASSFV